jgi:RsmE family RNA methyltransferase
VNLILFDPGEIGADGIVRVDDARASHMLRVLGAGVGRTVRVGVVNGRIGTGTIQSIADGTTVTLQCAFDAEPPPVPAVDLLLALPRPKVLRRLWAQIAAMGVGRIILTNAARVERDYFDTHVLAREARDASLIEGLQQARDTRLPVVSIHRQFKVLVEDELDGLFPSGLRVVAHPACQARLAAVVEQHAGGRVLLAIGPEGGWNAFELALLEARGFHGVGMGPRVLRSDTACLALLAVAHDAWRKGQDTSKFEL